VKRLATVHCRKALHKVRLPELDPDRQPNLVKRLAAVDRRRAAGEEIPAAVLLAALFYDLFDEAMGDRRGFQDVFTMMHQRFSDLVTRLRIPRREWDYITNLVARQSSFTRIVSGPRGKNYEKRFVRNAHYANSLMFFEIFAEAAGGYQEELKYWKERAARTIPDGNMRPAGEGGRRPEAAMQRPEVGAQRPEGSGGNRGRGRNRRRRNRGPHRPAGPGPAAGPVPGA
ncbi:MAG TPA: hypothetical protein PKN50_19050, partial [Spirochaetota bacterium]|nr:hypothetical protein [Spirochaetota bacterium]